MHMEWNGPDEPREGRRLRETVFDIDPNPRRVGVLSPDKYPLSILQVQAFSLAISLPYALAQACSVMKVLLVLATDRDRTWCTSCALGPTREHRGDASQSGVSNPMRMHLYKAHELIHIE